MLRVGRVGEIAESPGHAEIKLHIEHLLASPEFCQSRRCQQFLDYVTRRALEGREDLLKERSLAVDLFGRPPDWDPSEDTIVRVSAREVRRRLAQFYGTSKGTQETVRILLSPGSYVPEFQYAEPGLHSSPANSATEAESGKGRRWWVLAGAAGLPVAVGAILWAWLGIAHRTAFDEFWAPAWKGSGPLVIAVANPVVYLPSHRVEAMDREAGPRSDIPLQRKLLLPAAQLNAADFVAVEDSFVGFGDAVSVSSLAGLSMRHGRAPRVRIASKLGFSDLQEAPAFLIGAFTNRWTLEFTKNLRFHFDYTADQKAAIFDRQSSRYWTNPNRKDQSAPEDYLLVCRLESGPTGKFVVIAAGLMQFGTEAAGKLVADPAALNAVLNRLGHDWKGHNLEMVLDARVIENSPSPAGLVAWHVW